MNSCTGYFRLSESARSKVALCPTTSFAARSFSESGIAPAPVSIAPVPPMMRLAPARGNDYQARPVNGQLMGEPHSYRVFNDRWGCLLRSNGSRRAVQRFNSDVIVYCLHQSLTRTEISFCGLH